MCSVICAGLDLDSVMHGEEAGSTAEVKPEGESESPVGSDVELTEGKGGLTLKSESNGKDLNNL